MPAVPWNVIITYIGLVGHITSKKEYNMNDRVRLSKNYNLHTVIKLVIVLFIFVQYGGAPQFETEEVNQFSGIL